MDSLKNVLFSATALADPEAVRAAARRTWKAVDTGEMPSLELLTGWAESLHFWLNEAGKLAPLDPEGLTDFIRELREQPEGPEQERTLRESMTMLAEQCGAAASVFVEIADRLETVGARLRLEDEADR
jgi:hypothetical protein